jgi:hypothetical protein
MSELKRLEFKRAEIFKQIQALGDMRRGTLTERYLACGKAGCHCTQAGSQGHGPKYSLTWKEEGTTHTEYIPSKDVLQVKAQLQNHLRFRQLSKELVAVNEEICRLGRAPQNPGGGV